MELIAQIAGPPIAVAVGGPDWDGRVEVAGPIGDIALDLEDREVHIRCVGQPEDLDVLVIVGPGVVGEVLVHDHGTWAVVVGVDGPERNIYWKRTDDGTKPGYAKLEIAADNVMLEGDVVAMPTGVIHSVQNESDKTTISFHVYGKHLNHTGRSQFSPNRCTEEPFVIETH